MNSRIRSLIPRILALLLIASLALGLFAGCGEKASVTADPEETAASRETASPEVDRVAELLGKMTLEEKIGQMMIASFRIWQDDASSEKTNVTELNDAIRACLQQNHFGGTILFAENFINAEQTYRLTRDLQASNQKGSSVPLFICADQEGGLVARIGFGTTGIGNMALAATGERDCAKQMAEIYGKELRALGLNADYAPVIDVNSNPSNPVIGVRSFSDDPETVARFGLGYTEGLNRSGVISTLKHFPGHGDTNTDSHTGFPLIDKTYEELKAFELVPYKAAIDNGAEMIMTAHIQYPQIEKETYVSVSTGEQVYLPATMSKTILTDILRKDMGFDGVVVTDALDMRAITDNFAVEDVICKTVNAGADMLILPIISSAELFRMTSSVVKLTAGLVSEGKISESTIDEAVARILRLKEKRGILDETDFTVSEAGIENANETVGSAHNHAFAESLAKKALTVVKNENGAFPLKDPAGKTLLLFSDAAASRAGYGEVAAKKLGRGDIEIMVSAKDNKDECLKAASEAENVILISRAYSEACLDPNTDDGFSTGVFDAIIAQRHAAGKTAVVISCQLPYDAARFTDADAVILAYCSNALRKLPNESGE
ncbi:MAG: beta-hexosaminidase, partial [Clostridia bacterium]|nr:beta-hexosaminidase [Clostridia bacterium]